jgi:hypothetical protein
MSGTVTIIATLPANMGSGTGNASVTVLNATGMAARNDRRTALGAARTNVFYTLNSGSAGNLWVFHPEPRAALGPRKPVLFTFSVA